MSPQIEKQILEKLERIEDLLVKFVPYQSDLGEEEVLKIVSEGRETHKADKTRDFDKFILKEYPHLVLKKAK
ncbi:MAG: hypothetical protein NTZ65_03620 [Candidatus Berkelbacteria bacterium]|nr:hypothetical protein [Candidatus Berkelbacteria bacterium]